MHDERERCWQEFLEAAEASAVGEHSLSRDLVKRHPIVRDELRNFVRAIVAGRIVKTREGWKASKANKRGVAQAGAVVDKPPAGRVVEA